MTVGVSPAPPIPSRGKEEEKTGQDSGGGG
jgi:hypothetical protein